MDPITFHHVEGQGFAERDFEEGGPFDDDIADSALLLVPDEKVAEGAQQLLAPFALSLPERGEFVVVVEEAGVRVAQKVRAMLRGRDTGTDGLWVLYPQEGADELREGLTPILREVAKASRRRAGQTPFVYIEDFPSVSEDEIGCLVAEIRKLCGNGAAVLVTMDPESYQIVEEMPEAIVVRAQELLYRLPYRDDEGVRAAWARTRGIPALVEPLRKGGEPASSRYESALAQVVASSLRDGLPAEERQMRLSMILLGRGTFAELSYTATRADRESFDLLADEAPFFGIDPADATFECAGVNDFERLKGCYSPIRSVEGIDDEVWLRATEALCRRGDFARAAFCCGLCGSAERQCKSVLRWGVEFCLTGALKLVRDGLSLARKLYMEEEEGYRLTQRAYRAMVGKAPRAAKADEPLGVGGVPALGEREYGYITLLAADRRLTFGAKPLEHAVTYIDALTVPMSEHIAALGHILAGRPSQAVREISTGASVGWPTCLAEALLVDDLRLATALIGEVPSPSLEPVFERARRLVEETRERRYVTYQRVLPEVLNVIGGGQAGALLDQAVAQAERCGDRAVQAALLIVGAVSDLRRKSWVPAHVRAQHAASVLQTADNRYLRQAALLIDAVALTARGEPGFLRELALGADKGRSAPCDLARMLVSSGCDAPFGGGEEGARLDVPRDALRMQALSPSHLGHDALWLTHVLATDCGAVSGLFALRLPKAWRRVLGEAEFGPAEPAAGKGAPEPGSGPDGPGVRFPDGPLVLPGTPEPEGHSVYLSLLGGFTISLDGRQIMQRSLSRRHAITLIAMLAAAPGHALHRSELIEVIWPGRDTETGTQRLYESVSAVRAVFGCKRGGFDVFRMDKPEKIVAFDTTVVTCDVDLFEETVSQVTMNEGLHEAVVEQAGQARTLYRGDLDIAAMADAPEATTRRDELRGMFATAMVAGARAAMATERHQLAVQFAQDAYAADRIREDAVAALMEALCLAGRTAEGQKIYAQYSTHLIATMGLPPSRVLRELAASLFPAGDADGGVGPIP